MHDNNNNFKQTNKKKKTIQKLQSVLNVFGSTNSYCMAINITTEPTA